MEENIKVRTLQTLSMDFRENIRMFASTIFCWVHSATIGGYTNVRTSLANTGGELLAVQPFRTASIISIFLKRLQDH